MLNFYFKNNSSSFFIHRFLLAFKKKTVIFNFFYNEILICMRIKKTKWKIFLHSEKLHDGNKSVFKSIIFNAFWWICREEFLALSHQSFKRLNIFSLGFIIQHVSDVLWKDFFSSGTSVDTNHSYSDWPWSIAYCHLKICIWCFDIIPRQKVSHDDD